MMNNKLHIFFDLDGTIIDSEESILSSIDYATKKLGLPTIPYETKLKFIGPPMRYSFMTFCGMSEQSASEAYAAYREMYADKGVHMARVYDGVKDMLLEIKMSGKKLYTATSKPEKFAKIILKENGLIDLFDFVAGASMDKSRTTKFDVLQYAIEQSGAESLNDCALLGDRYFDADGAKQAGIDCIGVLWGFGSKQELINAGVVAVCETPSDVTKLICSQK